MRLALCQINTTIGHFEKNLSTIKSFLLKARKLGADAALFPELSLSSYPPLDLLDREDFLNANQNSVQEFEKFIANNDVPALIIIGSITENKSTSGRRLFNSALVYHKSKRIYEQHKRLLPTYDVFDEARYFERGTKSELFIVGDHRFGVCICEDSWFEDEHGGKKLYDKDPALDLKGADLVFNLSASPYVLKKKNIRKKLISAFAKRVGSPLLYVNQIGANDEILFDGESFVSSGDGKILYAYPSFEEGLGLIDLDLKTANASNTRWYCYSSGKWTEEEKVKTKEKEILELNDSEELFFALSLGIKDYFAKTGFKKAILGLSGGIDSAIVACLAKHALGSENVIGISMPSQYSSTGSLTDSEDLARNLGIEYRVHSLKFIFKTVLMELTPSFLGLPEDVTEENLQSRLRGLMLMALSNKRQALVLTTGNKSELAVGYCTTYGDMIGAIGPLGDVYKTRVYDLAEYINKAWGWIPENSITKPPSAELRPNQKDQDSLPPYDILDGILERYLEGQETKERLIEQGFDAKTVEKVLHLVKISEFKRRQAAPVLKVTSKAFGLGRRIPVAKGF